jgi:hypothetical protein
MEEKITRPAMSRFVAREKDQKSSARVYPFRMILLEAAEGRSSKNLGMLRESSEIAAKSDQHASWFAAI